MCSIIFCAMAITVVVAALDEESSIMFRNIESCARRSLPPNQRVKGYDL
jgi:hypothetical protein